jgi:hypothetical protein
MENFTENNICWEKPIGTMFPLSYFRLVPSFKADGM